jgi:hypothetical protein
MEIWTEDEDDLRQLDNLMNPKGKTCKNCQWSNYEKGDKTITCGHHIQNFSTNSFCAYWTNPKDSKLIAYFEKKKEQIRVKLTHGTARVDKSCSDQTLKALDELSKIIYEKL